MTTPCHIFKALLKAVPISLQIYKFYVNPVEFLLKKIDENLTFELFGPIRGTKDP